MQVGDLIKDRHGNFGVIVGAYYQQQPNPNHVWVLWNCGSETTIHKRHLYKIS